MENKIQTLITGAAGGMGQALCKELIYRNEAIFAIDKHGLEFIESNVLVEKQTIDFSNPSFPNELPRDRTLKGLVHLAGISIGDSVEKITLDDWNTSFQVNVTSIMQLVQFYYNSFVSNSSIVLIGSPVGVIGARKPSYAASKAALHGFMMTLARELAPRKIRVNLVLPGTVLSPMTSDWSEEKQSIVAKQNMQKRLFNASEIAKVIQFLLSNDASMITGASIDTTSGALWGGH